MDDTRREASFNHLYSGQALLSVALLDADVDIVHTSSVLFLFSSVCECVCNTNRPGQTMLLLHAAGHCLRQAEGVAAHQTRRLAALGGCRYRS